MSAGTTTVSQGGQTRTFTSDWLGRPTSIQEPESGTTTYGYAYNSTGLQVTRQKPRANQSNPSTTTATTTQYDSIGRPWTISYSDGTPTKYLSYDQGNGWGGSYPQTNVIGRITAAYIPNSTATIYGYDSMGRVTLMGECTPSTCGTTGYPLYFAYNYAGNLLSSTDGGGTTTSYSVSPADQLLSMTSSLNNTTNPSNLISSVQYGPNGPASFNLGSGLSASYTYDSLGRVSGGAVNAGGTQMYSFSSGWKGSQLQTSSDAVLSQTSTYGYDEFNRLASRTVTSGTPQNFTWEYDRWGNRTKQTVTAGSGPQPQYTMNTANNRIVGFTYDAAGNITNDGSHSYTYDAEGNITQVDTATATYVYDALNHRVKTTTGSATTEFLYNVNGQRDSEWNASTHAQLKGHYYWGSKPVAYYTTASGGGAAAHFEHQDWLGTERMRTNYNGGVEGTYTSLPWGDAQSSTGSDQDAAHYATLDYDSETNTDHAQFRQYNPTQGRFMSPDPYGGSYDTLNPQSMNRYVYAMNNPLGNIDPSGLCDPFNLNNYSADEAGFCAPMGFFYGGNGSGAGVGSNDFTGVYGPDSPGYMTWVSNWQPFQIYKMIYTNNQQIMGPPETSWLDMGYWAMVWGTTGSSTPTVVGGPSSVTGGGAGGPNNQRNSQIQNCLEGVYDTPDGKIYDFFSIASPIIGPDASFGEFAKEAGKEGAWQFVKKASKNLAGSPLGKVSGLTYGLREAYEAAVAPVVAAATVAQVFEYTACHFAPW